MRERGVRHILVVDDAGRLVSVRDLVEDRALRAIGDRVWRPAHVGGGGGVCVGGLFHHSRWGVGGEGLGVGGAGSS